MLCALKNWVIELGYSKLSLWEKISLEQGTELSVTNKLLKEGKKAIKILDSYRKFEKPFITWPSLYDFSPDYFLINLKNT